MRAKYGPVKTGPLLPLFLFLIFLGSRYQDKDQKSQYYEKHKYFRENTAILEKINEKTGEISENKGENTQITRKVGPLFIFNLFGVKDNHSKI